MRLHNSTIRVKQKICANCGKPCFWFSKKRCNDCSRIEDTLAKMEVESEEEIKKEGLSDLIKVADDHFSKLIRLSYADENGIVECFTCHVKLRWQHAQNGHYIKRGNLFLRFDTRNCRPQCQDCNEYKHGNMAEFTRRLELEHSGITEILKEEAALAYKPTRHEIQAIIADCKQKIKALSKPIKNVQN